MQVEYKIAETKEELHQMFDLRIEVFVKEQNVPQELELDEYDTIATHFIALQHGVVIGCGRILFQDSYTQIGRVAVRKCHRNEGLGKGLMQNMINICLEKGYRKIILHAQLPVVHFYESLGFKVHGDIFLDAGIEHLEMIWETD